MSQALNWRTRATPSPQLRAGCLSQLLVWWINDIVKLAKKRPLEERDVYEILPEDSSVILVNDLAREWEKELYSWRTRSKASLFSALLRCYGVKLIACAITLLVEETTKFCLIILIGELVSTFDKTSHYTDGDAYLLALGVSLVYIVWTLLGHVRYHFYHNGLKIQSAVTGLIYRKVLKLSYHVLQDSESAQSPIRLVAISAKHLETVLLVVQYLWVGVVDLIAVIPILWLYMDIGVATMPGVLLLLILVPVQLALGRKYTCNVVRGKAYTSARVQLVTEVINSIRMVKANCWERVYSSFINTLRTKETEHANQSAHYRGLTGALHLITSKMAVFLVAITYVLYLQRAFTAQQVIVLIALLDQIHHNISLLLTWAIQDGAQTVTEILNIRDFLVLEERGLEEEKLLPEAPLEGNTAVNIDNFSATWSMDSESMPKILCGISLKVTKGEFLAISGPKNSGKTALLLAILGELHKMAGTLQIRGRCAYINKSAWIFACSLRENIIFGREFDIEKYRRVVSACELNQDFERFPALDLSEIRDSDVAPDDGLRVRLALARCIYHDLDVLLLDDPFNLMENDVTMRIITNCFHRLLCTKTVILVTNYLELLKAANKIILLKEGSILGTGTYSDINTFASIPGFLTDLEIVKLSERDDVKHHVTEAATLSDSKLDTLSSATTDIDDVDLDSPFEDNAELVPTIHTDDTVETTWRTYRKYLTMGYGVLGIVTILVLSFLSQLAFVVCDWWIFYWTIKAPNLTNASYALTTTSSWSVRQRDVIVYFCFVASYLLLSLSQTCVLHAVLCKAASVIHKRILNGFLRTTFLFVQEFDTFLSKLFFCDIAIVDNSIVVQVSDIIHFTLLYASTLAMEGLSNPWLIIILIPQVCFYLFVRSYFIRTSRDLKHMENLARDEVCQVLSNTMHGIRPIRYLDAGERYLRHFDNRQDRLVATSYLSIVNHRWMALRLDLLLVITLMVLVFLAVLTLQKTLLYPELNGAYVGLALLYAVRFHAITHLSIGQSSQLAQQMTSVSRLLHHSDLPPEENPRLDTVKLPPLWPPYGIITFEGVSMQYEEKGVKVLRNFWCCIRAQEKVGVLRRKGVDCSALVSAVYRLIPYSGAVWIDGYNIAELSITDLRDRMSLIPEEPHLFTGTLRQNLDPNNHMTDAVLWRALKEVHIADKVESLPLQLQTRVSADKPIFSTAQIQQLCLARALVRRTKIIIYEETQAGYDSKADAAMQAVLRTAFTENTVICITHRIDSIIDYDRVLVIEDGRLLEYDPAHALLLQTRSALSRLVDELPRQQQERLRRRAQDKYENRPYVAPDTNTQTTLIPEADRIYFRQGRNFLPTFQTNRLSHVLSNLSPSNI